MDGWESRYDLSTQPTLLSRAAGPIQVTYLFKSTMEVLLSEATWGTYAHHGWELIQVQV